MLYEWKDEDGKGEWWLQQFPKLVSVQTKNTLNTQTITNCDAFKTWKCFLYSTFGAGTGQCTQIVFLLILWLKLPITRYWNDSCLWSSADQDTCCCSDKTPRVVVNSMIWLEADSSCVDTGTVTNMTANRRTLCFMWFHTKTDTSCNSIKESLLEQWKHHKHRTAINLEQSCLSSMCCVFARQCKSGIFNLQSQLPLSFHLHENVTICQKWQLQGFFF